MKTFTKIKSISQVPKSARMTSFGSARPLTAVTALKYSVSESRISFWSIDHNFSTNESAPITRVRGWEDFSPIRFRRFFKIGEIVVVLATILGRAKMVSPELFDCLGVFQGYVIVFCGCFGLVGMLPWGRVFFLNYLCIF